MKTLPVIYSAHHASANFGTFADRCALTREQQIRCSDYGTKSTVPQNGVLTLVGEYSRGLVDLNRAPDATTLFRETDFACPPHDIWLSGKEPTAVERAMFKKTIYEPYHQKILSTLQTQDQPTWVIAWDNTAPYIIGNNAAGVSITMPSIILSNSGNEGECPGADVTCDPDILHALGEMLQTKLAEAGLPHDIMYNVVYKGGFITQHYTNFQSRRDQNQHLAGYPSIQSFQVEYSTALTHDVDTLTAQPHKIALLRSVFESSIANVLPRAKTL